MPEAAAKDGPTIDAIGVIVPRTRDDMQKLTATCFRATSTTFALMLLSTSHARGDEPPARGAAYACGNDASLTIIAADEGSTPPAGYRLAQTGRQTIRCGTQVSAMLNVVAPQERGMCAGAGQVIITDISIAGWPADPRLFDINKECVFNDFITRLTIRRAETSYEVESCAVASRFNKDAHVGCTTDVTQQGAAR